VRDLWYRSRGLLPLIVISGLDNGVHLNVSSNSVISLCVDQDTTLWNGNEGWIEVDKMSATNGAGSYTFDPSNILPGKYYVGGYVYDKKLWTFTESHAVGQITIPTPTFSLSGPAFGTFTAGQPITITWTAADVSSNSVISLCYGTDTMLWNKTDHWIEVDQVSAANGSGSYTWNTTGIAPGTYYIGGYMYDKVTHLFTYSHHTQLFTIAAAMSQFLSSNNNTLGVGMGGSDGASLADNVNKLSIASKDLVFGSPELTQPSAPQRITDADGSKDQNGDGLLAQTGNKQELSAIDAALQDQDMWLEKQSAELLAYS
jgi:hypothetical protein